MTVTCMALRELEQAVERIRAGVDVLVPVADLREALLHRDHGEVARFGRIDLVPGERR